MFDLIPIVYRALQKRTEIETIIERLKPYVTMAKADHDLWPKIGDVVNHILQGDAQPEMPTMEWIQTQLNVWGAATQPGWVPLKVDGRGGPKTDEAIRAFQTANGLYPDGNFGAKSYAVMSAWLLRNGQSVSI